MFYDRLDTVCKSRGTTVTGLAKSLGLSTSRQATWKKSGAPKGEELSRIADFLDVSAEYLLEKTDNPQNPKVDVDPETAEAMELFKNLSREQRENVLGIMRGLSTKK